jgi:preprotein translocase subunit SecG
MEGYKDKNLRKLQKKLKDLEESDDIEDIEDTFDYTKPSDYIEESIDNIKIEKIISKVEYIPLPETYIFGFSNYEFHENPYMFKYDIILRLANYPYNKIDSITMKIDLLTSKSEEEEVTCIKTRNMSSDIYRFVCSKEVSEPVSQISYINNSIILNGKIPLNSSTSEIANFLGKNIQLQTKNCFSDPEIDLIFFKNCYVYGENNKLIFEGETNGFKITSRESLLAFGQGEYIKNIVCDITEKGNNKFKMVCEPTFIINVNFKGNNAVYLNNLEKIIMMRFEEGNSSTIFEDYNSNIKLLKKTSSEGSSKGLIFFIIILFIALLVIIIIIVYLCKKRAKETNQKNETNPSEPSENKTTLPSESKDTITKNNISGGAGLNINKDKKNL